MNFSVERVVASAGLMMQPLPDASDAATVQHMSRIGKVERHDVDRYAHRLVADSWKDPACVVPATLPASSRAISAK